MEDGFFLEKEDDDRLDSKSDVLYLTTKEFGEEIAAEIGPGSNSSYISSFTKASLSPKSSKNERSVFVFHKFSRFSALVKKNRNTYFK